jgi:hypothetical protein
VSANDQPFFVQLLQVATDRVGGDIESFGELGHGYLLGLGNVGNEIGFAPCGQSSLGWSALLRHATVISDRVPKLQQKHAKTSKESRKTATAWGTIGRLSKFGLEFNWQTRITSHPDA